MCGNNCFKLFGLLLLFVGLGGARRFLLQEMPARFLGLLALMSVDGVAEGIFVL
jgi:hypothetical protein